MSGTANSTLAAALAQLIASCRQQTEKYIKECPENRRLVALSPGKATPLWLVGHISSACDFLGSTIGLGLEPLLPSDWRPKFAPDIFGGKPITTNAADYPRWDEVAAMYSRVLSRYSDGLKSLSDADLAGPPKGKLPDALKSMIPTIQAGASLNVIHDSHHRGQLALISKLK